MADNRFEPAVAIANEDDELRRRKGGQQMTDYELVCPRDVVLQIESGIPFDEVLPEPCEDISPRDSRRIILSSSSRAGS